MQKEMIANLQEKNILLANISTTIKSLKGIVERVSNCEKEKAELEHEIQLKIAERQAALSKTEHQHIESAKIKIDAYIDELRRKIDRLDSEVKELRQKKKTYEEQLIEKEQELELAEKKFHHLKQFYGEIYKKEASEVEG